MSRSILDYFSKERSKVNLPDPRGPLSSKLLPSTIAAANTEVMRVMNSPSVATNLKSGGEKLRDAYNKYTPELKAKVANGNWQLKLLENSALLIKLLMRVLFEGGSQCIGGRWKGNEKLVRKFPLYLCYLKQNVAGHCFSRILYLH